MLRLIRIVAVGLGLVLIGSGIYTGRTSAWIIGLIVAAVNARQLWREARDRKRGAA